MSSHRWTLPDGQVVVLGSDGAKLPSYGWVLRARPTDSSRWRKP